MKLFWNWLLFKIGRYSRVTPNFAAQHSIYCPKCGGCGYVDCCDVRCGGGLFCAGYYRPEDMIGGMHTLNSQTLGSHEDDEVRS